MIEQPKATQLVREVWKNNFAEEIQNLADHVNKGNYTHLFFVSKTKKLTFLGHRVCGHLGRNGILSVPATEVQRHDDEDYSTRHHRHQQRWGVPRTADLVI
jgi:hypothetical protein